VPKSAFIVAGAADERIGPRLRDAAIKTVRDLDSATGNGVSCGAGCNLYASPTGTNVRVLIHPGGHEYPASVSPLIVSFFKNHALAN
jgi:polyhydroxybutyrate depolymerase